MRTWGISHEDLRAWAREVIAKYPPLDITLFIIRLKKVGA
jgi:hypothetical protein